MKEFHSDILIVGSGLIGLVTAYSLSLLGFKIILTEKNVLLKENDGILSDIRTIAISEGSKQFLNEIGVWKKISKFAQPITNIDVIDRKKINKINFFNMNHQGNLGYIVKNSKLIQILKSELIKKKNVYLFDQSTLININYKSDKIEGLFANKKVLSKLLIAADGKNSSVRNILKTPFYKKKYTENALVLNFFHSKNHKNTAFEFFYKNGPLALLPMKKENSKFQSSMIWSNNPEFLSSLFLSKDKIIKDILSEKISNEIGEILKINSKQIFPLSSHINERFYERKLLYVGDSAHSVHPIAGQGWNLGLRDIKNLYHLAEKINLLGLSIGSERFCLDYNESCFYDAYRLYQVTDKLNWAFKKDSFFMNNFRSFGFSIIDKNNYLKKIITNFAMGF